MIRNSGTLSLAWSLTPFHPGFTRIEAELGDNADVKVGTVSRWKGAVDPGRQQGRAQWRLASAWIKKVCE